MKKVADTYHLFRRDGVWYYRRRVPKHVASAFGRTIVQFSLDTCSKAEATKLREMHDVHLSAEFDRIERGDTPTNQTSVAGGCGLISMRKNGALSAGFASKLVRDYVTRLDHRSARRFAEHGGAESQEELEDITGDLEIELGILTSLSDPRGDEQLSSAFRALHKQAGILEPHRETEGYGILLSYLRRGLIEHTKRRLARWQKGYTKPYFDPLFQPDAPTEVTIAELAEQFLQLKEEEGKANGIKLKSLERVMN